MKPVTTSALRTDSYNTTTHVNESCSPLYATRLKGTERALAGRDEWAAIEDTLYLMGAPGMAEDLVEGLNADISDFVPSDQVEW